MTTRYQQKKTGSFKESHCSYGSKPLFIWEEIELRTTQIWSNNNMISTKERSRKENHWSYESKSDITKQNRAKKNYHLHENEVKYPPKVRQTDTNEFETEDNQTSDGLNLTFLITEIEKSPFFGSDI